MSKFYYSEITTRLYQGAVIATLLSLTVAGSVQKLGGQEGWYYLVSDDAIHRLYITHNSRVEVVDSNTGKPIGATTGLKVTHGVARNLEGKIEDISGGAEKYYRRLRPGKPSLDVLVLFDHLRVLL